jgi:lipopolysaccharide biosynthesis glycosyltransferase
MAEIHVALTFDDAYWAPAYATVRSAALASRRREDLVFHLVHHGLKAEHRETIETIATEFPVTLVDHPVDSDPHYDAFISNLVAVHFPRMTYVRLIIGELLPDVDRLIFLDSDMLVRAPLETLADLDLVGKAVAAVLDPHRHRAMLGRDFKQHADLFDFNQGYFNAGMMVVDRARYAAAGLPQLAAKLNNSGALASLQYDQAVLNIGLKDNWLPLDFRWNLINPEPAHEALEPHIVHYTGPHKPWHLLSRVAFAQAYRHTMTNDIFYAYWRERQVKRLAAPFRRKG